MKSSPEKRPNTTATLKTQNHGGRRVKHFERAKEDVGNPVIDGWLSSDMPSDISGFAAPGLGPFAPHPGEGEGVSTLVQGTRI